MFTKEQYEKELKRLQRNQRQIRPTLIFCGILAGVLFLIGGIFAALGRDYGYALIGLGVSTIIMLGILFLISHLEKKQLTKMQDRDRYILEESRRINRELDEKYREYKEKGGNIDELDELIEYDMLDEDFDEK